MGGYILRACSSTWEGVAALFAGACLTASSSLNCLVGIQDLHGYMVYRCRVSLAMTLALGDADCTQYHNVSIVIDIDQSPSHSWTQWCFRVCRKGCFPALLIRQCVYIALMFVLVFVASIRRWVNFCPILTPKNKQSCQLARGYAYRIHLPIPYNYIWYTCSSYDSSSWYKFYVNDS
jgi:hypothetical protein